MQLSGLRAKLAFLGLSIVLLFGGGFLLYHFQEQPTRKNVENNLQAISQLKVDEITRWREERLNDAADVVSAVFLYEAIDRWLNKRDANDLDRIKQRLNSVRKHQNWLNLVVVDSRGDIQLSLTPRTTESVHEMARSALSRAMATRKPQLSEIHANNGVPPHIDVIAPLFTKEGRAIGAVILQADIRLSLYPLIQNWPIPSNSAENLLVRRDGDSALFLNVPRTNPDAALNLRIPLTRTEVVGAKAVSGVTGFQHGKDYRNVPVFAYLRPVPNSDWYLVTKVDETEAMVEWHARSRLIVTAVLSLAAALMAGIAWLARSGAQYKALYESEAAHRLSQERFRHFSESSADWFWEMDANLRFTYFSENFASIFGLSPASVLGKTRGDLVARTPLNDKAILDAHLAILEQHLPFRDFEYRIQDAAGEVRWMSVSGIPIFEPDGRFIGYRGTGQNITPRKKLEEELQEHRRNLEEKVQLRTAELAEARRAAEAANAAKSAFLASMSHEIRTPMNAVLGMTHLIRRSGVTPQQAERLEKIDAAGRHLLDVINAILDLSKIEAGHLVLEEKEFSLPAVLSNVASILQERARAKNLALTVEAPELPFHLLGDSTRLQQALVNYAGNAIKFTETGGVSIRAYFVSGDDEGALIRFEVTDTGIGVSPQDVERLFKPFEQADNTTSRKYGGTGLGLAITRKLAEAMGGEAGARGTPGVGSTFWFTARLKKADHPVEEHDEHIQLEASIRRTCGGRRILLVEDDAVNREVATELLEDLDLLVDWAGNGVDAVTKASEKDYDLILMDIQMPRMDGLEATRRIRARDTGTRTPIIAMTANAFAEDREKCKLAGMDDFLAKPILRDVFNACLLKWLDKDVSP